MDERGRGELTHILGGVIGQKGGNMDQGSSGYDGSEGGGCY